MEGQFIPLVTAKKRLLTDARRRTTGIASLRPQ